MPGLNHKQKKFAAEYLVDGNATQAAIRAGYSARTAHSAGPRLLENVGVKALIEAKREKVISKLEVKGEKVLAELAHFAHSDPAQCFGEDGVFLEIPKMPEAMRRAIKSFEIEELYAQGEEGRYAVGRTVKIAFWPKDKGLELLGKNQKLFVDVKEHRVDDSLADLLAAARAPDGDGGA